MFRWMKIFIGIVLISCIKLAESDMQLKNDNFFLGILIAIPFWLVLFIFLDWREWVTKDEGEQNGS